MDANKEDTAQQLYNEMQAAYEQEHGHGAEQVEASGTAKESSGVMHAELTTLSEARLPRLSRGVIVSAWTRSIRYCGLRSHLSLCVVMSSLQVQSLGTHVCVPGFL